MSMIETSNNTFWTLVQEGKKSLLIFNDKDDAISKLTEFEDPNKCQIISLTRQGTEWEIEQVSWQEIASALITKVRK